MEKIAKFAGKPLAWTRLKKSQSYELRSGSDLVATLWMGAYENFSATATSADGCWTFMRTENGSRSNRSPIEIQDFHARKRIALYLPGILNMDGNGKLMLASGKEFSIASSFFGNRYSFSTAEGKVLFIHKNSLLRLSATVELQVSAADVTELPWMVLLGWYIRVRQRFDLDHAGGG